MLTASRRCWRRVKSPTTWAPWAIGRPSEIRLVARLAAEDARSPDRAYDAYVSLAKYLEELHAALRERRIFDPPCCGGFTVSFDALREMR